MFFSSVLIADDKPLAPASVLKLVSCGCSSDQPCGTARCGCYGAHLPCTMLCSCYQTCNCANRLTTEADNNSDSEAEDCDGKYEA
ncbi:hypothetical protein DPMN_168993 [Dreissena polymorpha]|uniref:Uncharacterized protein n=1 Tax=Dreissena polymorpha TaxID=45954 RepID=A0A9D4F3R2_DREPO|nr:hypothetical protein DPMN_168993 [Dreissena polymorpha]